MKRSTFNYIKDILKDYPKIDQYIKQREEELRYPFKAADVNADIKSKGKPADGMSNLLITIDQDRRLASLERNKRVIMDNLYLCDEDTYIIIHELYIKKYRQYTMDGLVDNHIISCGRSKAFQLRDQFFEHVADDLNLDK
ncbi:transcriptional regulator [Hutsoniella sourekii]|uniref:transcriptional regulator n=1 Tax=Hutsoniella sourekii TaxID=87650 RepID=UPI000483378D|nr:transcriptional regulator [Hutsoniella sourekii]